MSRLSIENLPKPPKAFRPNLILQNKGKVGQFETKEKSKEEELKRLSLIKKLLDRSGGDLGKPQRKAIKRLLKNVEKRAGQASPVYMRKHRIRIAGWLFCLVEDDPSASVATIIPRGCQFSGGELETVDPKKILNRFRSALIRSGARATDGWLFCGIHGEHDSTKNMYQIHFHVVGTKGMESVIRKLSKKRDYKSRQTKKGDLGRGIKRVRLTGRLRNLPAPLTYVLQSYWPSKASFRNSNGKEKRQRTKHRIKEPNHTEVLLWLDKWRLKDFTLLVGLRVEKAGLCITQKRTPTSGHKRV